MHPPPPTPGLGGTLFDFRYTPSVAVLQWLVFYQAGHLDDSPVPKFSGPTVRCRRGRTVVGGRGEQAGARGEAGGEGERDSMTLDGEGGCCLSWCSQFLCVVPHSSHPQHTARATFCPFGR